MNMGKGPDEFLRSLQVISFPLFKSLKGERRERNRKGSGTYVDARHLQACHKGVEGKLGTAAEAALAAKVMFQRSVRPIFWIFFKFHTSCGLPGQSGLHRHSRPLSPLHFKENSTSHTSRPPVASYRVVTWHCLSLALCHIVPLSSYRAPITTCRA